MENLESSFPCGQPSYRLEQPDIEDLHNKGYTLVDMHVHTTSSDGADSARFVLARAHELGIGVSITDHNRIGSSLKAFGNDLGVMVIPGIEATSREGRHFLLYFYEPENLKQFFMTEMKNGKRRLTADGLMDLKGNYNYLISAAHPNGFKSWHDLKIDFDILRIEALEILNSKVKVKHAKKSYEWAQDYNKGYTGGTDAHMAREIGKIVTCSLRRGVRGFLDSIKNRETFVVGTFYPMKNKIWDYMRLYPAHRIRSTFYDLFGR